MNGKQETVKIYLTVLSEPRGVVFLTLSSPEYRTAASTKSSAASSAPVSALAGGDLFNGGRSRIIRCNSGNNKVMGTGEG